MPAASLKHLGRFLLSAGAFTLMAGMGVAHAQTASAGATNALSPAGPSRSPLGALPNSGIPLPRTNLFNGVGWTGPEFQADAIAVLQESYVTNATGVPGHSQSDVISSPGLKGTIHEHTAQISLDANYNFLADFYSRGTIPTQFDNHVEALGKFDVIPEYLDLDARAFAAPVVVTNFGAVSAGGRVVPGEFRNSAGYFATPDLTFNLGDIASSKTIPTFGQVFFTQPAGTSAANTLSGIPGPVDTTVRSVIEEISSGPDFELLNWKLIGLLSETDRDQKLLSEKTGIADARYTLNPEWDLLLTGGYDSIHDTTPLTHNVSGPVALAGFGLTLGQEFVLNAQAGTRFNSLSVIGNMRYDLGPVTALTASANDYVMTPEGRLLNNLTSLTALANGTLTSTDNVLENGTASSLTGFDIQSPDNPSLDQLVSRFQTVMLSLAEELPRTQVFASLFGTRRTILTTGFEGPPVVNTWGSRILASRDINPLLKATLGITYTRTNEFGGETSIIQPEAQVTYSLSRMTHVYLRSDYVDRISSSEAVAASPLAGSVTDLRVTLGIDHTL